MSCSTEKERGELASEDAWKARDEPTFSTTRHLLGVLRKTELCQCGCRGGTRDAWLSEPLFEASFFSQQVARTWVKKNSWGRFSSAFVQNPIGKSEGSFKRTPGLF